MSFELTILGSSSALPTSKRFPTAHLLKVDERFFLVDCGEGTQMQLRRFAHNPGRIHHIFISHLHGDHIFGLFGLLSSMGMMGRKVALNLYGPKALKSVLDMHFSFFGLPPFELKYINVRSAGTEAILSDKRIEVFALPLEHRVESFGYLFREKASEPNIIKERIEELGLGLADIVRIKKGEGFTDASGNFHAHEDLTHPPYARRSYAYLSDTRPLPGLTDRIRGVDILFHEATFASEDAALAKETMHSTSIEAAEIARDAGVGRLLIGHFSSRYKDAERLVEEARSSFPATEGVHDGAVYSIERRRIAKE